MKELPISLLDQLRHVDGFDEAGFMAAHRLPPATSVRLNPYKGTGFFAANEQVPWCQQGYYLKERPVFTLDPSYHAGAYYVQEASSMFLAHILDRILPVKKGLRVLDLCAAPGGKSTLIASLLEKDSLLISNDVIRTRASILEENMTRWGYMNTWVTSNDPRDFGRLHGYFDVIVVDAPCSGSGLFRKDERALNEWNEANVQMCSERQQRIIADIWPALKEDGILIYATCSYSPQENENILDWVASQFDVATIDVEKEEEWGITAVKSQGKNMTGYRLFPDKTKGEGFFIAAMQKKDRAETIHSRYFKSAHDKKVQSQAAFLLKDSGQVFIPVGKDEFCAMHPAHEADLQMLQKMVYLRKTGLRLGLPAAKEWLPAHEVALSVDANEQLPHVDVDKNEAMRFLKREDPGMQGLERGWHIIRYNGLGLGWIKSVGNRLNNYLPKHWRIRMEITDNEW